MTPRVRSHPAGVSGPIRARRSASFRNGSSQMTQDTPTLRTSGLAGRGSYGHGAGAVEVIPQLLRSSYRSQFQQTARNSRFRNSLRGSDRCEIDLSARTRQPIWTVWPASQSPLSPVFWAHRGFMSADASCIIFKTFVELVLSPVRLAVASAFTRC